MNKLGIRYNSKEEASLLELGKLYCLLVKRPLIDCTEIHIDGSFHCITSIFKQLVTIHAGKNNMVMLGVSTLFRTLQISLFGLKINYEPNKPD